MIIDNATVLVSYIKCANIHEEGSMKPKYTKHKYNNDISHMITLIEYPESTS